MKLCRLINYDIQNGLLRKGYVYLTVLLLSGVFFADFYYKFLLVQENGQGENQTVTMTNVMIYLFAGKEPFNPLVESAFVLPAVWLLIFLYSAFLTLNYPYRNLMERGIQVIIRSGKRRHWWISKCVWLFTGTICYFLILYLGIAFFCFLFGIEISFSYASGLNEYLLNMQLEILSKKQIFCLVFFLPVMTALAINFVQLCMGLFLDRVYSYLLSAVILFSSTYFLSPFAIGNFAMLKRSIFYDNAGVTIGQGIVGNGSLILLSIILGLARIEKYDLIKKND
ncbi:MAG: hypothetical protein ACI4VG_01115 [Lachnospiraceae bacterium]